MKTNLIARLGFLALVLTLITTSLVSGTFAKYTKEVKGTDTVRAAKFEFDVKQGSTTFDTTGAAIDIFGIAADSGVTTSPAGIIAPGTTGDFDIEITNKSEVDVNAVLTFSETNSDNIPIYYVYNTQRYSSVLTGSYTGDNNGTYEALTELANDMSSVTLEATDGITPTTQLINLDWFWAFNSAGTGQSDTSDTAIGMAGTLPEVTLDITCTVTQVD